ncbi:hypothetical protein ALQ00_05102 [Pseudomonas syringae pv. tomato]|nr:hypothetical protein ALQ00_05102 [Pseudomonas syringae pv. tomato]
MRNDNLNHDHYRAALRVGMLFWTLRVPCCDAERHALHSDAGACGTITSTTTTIVRRSASACCSGRCASSFVTQSVTHCIPTLERAER